MIEFILKVGPAVGHPMTDRADEFVQMLTSNSHRAQNS